MAVVVPWVRASSTAWRRVKVSAARGMTPTAQRAQRAAIFCKVTSTSSLGHLWGESRVWIVYRNLSNQLDVNQIRGGHQSDSLCADALHAVAGGLVGGGER